MEQSARVMVVHVTAAGLTLQPARKMMAAVASSLAVAPRQKHVQIVVVVPVTAVGRAERLVERTTTVVAGTVVAAPCRIFH